MVMYKLFYMFFCFSILVPIYVSCARYENDKRKNSDIPPIKLEKATFAGGCFWCIVPSFDKLGGVVEVVSGYTGGRKENPTYAEVSSGKTGHVEAIHILYDPSRVSYEDLLDVFWKQIDPTDPGGQFVDRGPQYKTAIFYHTDEQKRLAGKSKESLQKSGKYNKPIVTEILAASAFYRAEECHQDYHNKNPLEYEFYRSSSGRDQFIKMTWGDGGKGKRN